MSTAKGYYSVVQYCPDASRSEGANVGVVLFCPEIAFVDAAMAEGNDRVKRFFGPEGFDTFSINAAKESLRERLMRERQSLRTLDDFLHFIETRANELRITPPRPLKVLDPALEMRRLFDELVGGRKKRQTVRTPNLPELDRFFRGPSLVQRVKLDTKVRVPIANVELTIPYIYQNGALNLVKPQRFVTIEPALRLACEGDMLQRHPENARERKLIVLPVTDESDRGSLLRRQVGEMFGEYRIRVVQPDEVRAFTEEVEREAHAV